jgi:hypothetical protein
VHRHYLRLMPSLIAPFLQKSAGAKATGVHRHYLRLMPSLIASLIRYETLCNGLEGRYQG